MNYRQPVLVLLLTLTAFPGSLQAQGEMPPGGPSECAAPAEIIRDDAQLEHIAARLQQGAPIRIVAIGGASTAGTHLGGPGVAYPARLQTILSQRYPRNRIVVINKAIAHQTAEQQRKRFARDVLPEQPTLVLWETGTYDAVLGVDLDEFAHTLQAGIEQLRDQGSDVMLIDMQYARLSALVLDTEHYQDTLAQVADVEDVYLFRRHELMHYWADTGIFDYSAPPHHDYHKLADQVYECLAYRLADAIAWGIR